MATFSERLKKIVVDQLGVDESEVVPHASFIEDLHADSLDFVELILSLEEEFGLEVSYEDEQKMRTVGDALEYLSQHPWRQQHSSRDSLSDSNFSKVL